MTDQTEKALLACLTSANLMVLVPKRRGTGYQRVPLGHHLTPIAELGMTKGWDMTGLDGHLEIEIKARCFSEVERAAVLEAHMPALSRFYGLAWREVDPTEFWRLHPVTPVSDSGATP